MLLAVGLLSMGLLGVGLLAVILLSVGLLGVGLQVCLELVQTTQEEASEEWRNARATWNGSFNGSTDMCLKRPPVQARRLPKGQKTI